MSWFEKRRQRQPMLVDGKRIAERYQVLRRLGFRPFDAQLVASYLEYRCLCHARLGGVTEIGTDLG